MLSSPIVCVLRLCFFYYIDDGADNIEIPIRIQDSIQSCRSLHFLSQLNVSVEITVKEIHEIYERGCKC